MKWLDARTPRTLAEVNEHIDAFREHYNTRRRHRSLLVGTTHITPAQAWDTWPHASEPSEPIDPDILWAKIKKYSREHTPAIPSAPPGPAAPPTPAARDGEGESWGIPEHIHVDKNGIVRVAGTRIYIGLRFKNRDLHAVVTNGDEAQFFTAHYGQWLFTIPLPIMCQREVTSQINIRYIQGATHRAAPKIMTKLECPRPGRSKPRTES